MYPRGLLVKALDCKNVVSEFVVSRDLTFIFGQIDLGKVSSQLWAK